MPRPVRFLCPSLLRCVFVAATLGAAPLSAGSEPLPTEPAPADTGSRHGSFVTKAGPWGRLHCYYFYLEAPDSIVARVPLPDTQPRWRIPEAELEAFRGAITQSSLPAESVAALFDSRKVIRLKERAYLFPSHEMIERMTEADRQLIYPMLSSYTGNELYEFPLFFLSGSVDEWAQGSGLRDELVATIRALSYHRGNTLAFSDIPTLFSKAASDAEVQFVKKKLTRTRTFIARLELDSDSNLPGILDYWATGLNLRRKELDPLFSATAALPGIQFLDIVHLLPALPRKLLHTYPGEEFLTHSRLPDCHWTTLNFFNYNAQDYYLDTRLAAASIRENFVQVAPPYRFGDVLVFLDTQGRAFHSCIYLADEIVYSKNGANPLLPWVLIELGDLGRMYNLDIGKGAVRGFRHKQGRLGSE